MRFPNVSAAQAGSTVPNTSQGNLIIDVVSSQNNFPIENATVSISSETAPSDIIEELTTDSSGQTFDVSLPAPPEEYSLTPSDKRPYSEYHLHISAPGF